MPNKEKYAEFLNSILEMVMLGGRVLITGNSSLLAEQVEAAQASALQKLGSDALLFRQGEQLHHSFLTHHAGTLAFAAGHPKLALRRISLEIGATQDHVLKNIDYLVQLSDDGRVSFIDPSLYFSNPPTADHYRNKAFPSF